MSRKQRLNNDNKRNYIYLIHFLISWSCIANVYVYKISVVHQIQHIEMRRFNFNEKVTHQKTSVKYSSYVI